MLLSQPPRGLCHDGRQVPAQGRLPRARASIGMDADLVSPDLPGLCAVSEHVASAHPLVTGLLALQATSQSFTPPPAMPHSANGAQPRSTSPESALTAQQAAAEPQPASQPEAVPLGSILRPGQEAPGDAGGSGAWAMYGDSLLQGLCQGSGVPPTSCCTG